MVKAYSDFLKEGKSSSGILILCFPSPLETPKSMEKLNPKAIACLDQHPGPTALNFKVNSPTPQS